MTDAVRRKILKAERRGDGDGRSATRAARRLDERPGPSARKAPCIHYGEAGSGSRCCSSPAVD
jgi:hypothetical protein